MRHAVIPAGQSPEFVHGVSLQAVPMVVDCLSSPFKGVTVVVAAKSKYCDQWVDDVAFFHRLNGAAGTADVLPLPERPDEPDEDPRAFDIECDRISTLSRLNDFRAGETTADERLVVLTTPRAFFQAAPPREKLSKSEVVLKQGEAFGFQALINALGERLGYYSEAVCEEPGQFAVRGGIIDIYPVNAEAPVRIDFFGDDVDEIRRFDPATQRSEEVLPSIRIAALETGIEGERESNIFDYLPDAVQWIFVEPAELEDAFPGQFSYPERIRASLPHFGDLFERRDAFPADRFLGLAEFDTGPRLFGEATARTELATESLVNHRTFTAEGALGADRVEAEQTARASFLRQVLAWQKDGYAVHLVCNNQGEADRFGQFVQESDDLARLKPTIHLGELHEGFRIQVGSEVGKPAAASETSLPGIEQSLRLNPPGMVVLTDSEVFGRYRVRVVAKRRRIPKRTQVDQLLDFSELVEGDYLVHATQGICIYRGIQKMEMRGKPEDMISLEFDDRTTLHLPLHESHLISRYVGLSKARPKLAKLGGTQWEKTRRAAEKATIDFASELLSMQAKRSEEKGHAFAPDTEWQQEFEASFRFAPTPDQGRAIAEAKEGMEKPLPMDRLLCGDVGFGKTEVAIRCAFKAVMDGFQVAILVPTTVLAQQHFNTLRERLADFPFVVEQLSRFRTPKQQREIVKQLKQGRIDIVIGTHRLLSRDVQFQNLGFLVIDEEHRFGVRQKEKIKALKSSVDVLNMSATPIPRTLYMALMGARDLSVIETAPFDRLPIHTMIKGYDMDLIKKAVMREIDRGGQVFYLHNRVQTIASVAARLQEALPKVRIAFGHGQMEEGELEKLMTRFVANEFDMLVSTTIIESGLDIPNCNTIIIEAADRFGLSQLYQLRGRVGRFKRQAYCYLLLHRQTHVRDEARKRLSAMRQYNQLGAGFRIAMRDLELRGAGNILGSQQSGHIAGVGFDLYCSLLRQSVSRLKGEETAAHIRATVNLDFVSVGSGRAYRDGDTGIGYRAIKAADAARQPRAILSAYIPDNYIAETRLRIDFYRRLAMAAANEEVDEIEAAMVDRFGKLPEPASHLVTLARIRIDAERKRIQSVETEDGKLIMQRASGQPRDFVKAGSRFPRLTAKRPDLQLREIRQHIQRL